MITNIQFTGRYRLHLGRHKPIVYAEIAHYYPCCDIATRKRCSRCKEKFPCDFRRKK